jgi:6-phosphogluconolactonase
VTTAAGILIKTMAIPVDFRAFPARAAAAEAAAGVMENSIRAKLASGDSCSIVVSGGSTPGPCFDKLAGIPLDWSRVTVIPSDERWVPADHPESNRNRLLQNKASTAQILPLFRDGVEPHEAPELIQHDLAKLEAPVACALLGMGEDGHFASLFPDFDQLEEALDPHNKMSCLLVKTTASPHIRISLSLSALLRAEHTVLLIFGDAKRRVVDAATGGDTAYPVERLIRYVSKPLTVIWAP